MAKKEQNRWTHEVSSKVREASIITYAAKNLPILGSKSAVKKAIADKRLHLNGKPAAFSTKVKKGDRLELHGAGIQKAKKYDFDLEVVYEDAHLMVVNKPGGIAVNGNRQKTVENALAGVNNDNQQADALPRPVAAHRIDVPTNGLVLLAKTKTALIKLSKAFQKNQVSKAYLAVVHGKTAPNGRIEAPISGKEAITKFKNLRTVPSKVFQHLSLVQLHPITGRTHQLRIHLKDQGHLIVGDKQYMDGRKTILGKGLMLCACRLQFEHPSNGKKLDLKIEAPAKFDRILDREEERFKKK